MDILNTIFCSIIILFYFIFYAGLKNPFTLMSHVAPVMAVVTAIISIAMDPWHDFRASHFFDSSSHIIRSSLLLLLGGALAFFMVRIMCSFSRNNIYDCFSLRMKLNYYPLILKNTFPV